MTTLEEVLEGVEFASAGQIADHFAFLCRKTGKIIFQSENLDEPVPDDIDDEGQYLLLPGKKDLGLGKPLARRFAAEHLPEALAEVERIFSRAGAYARLKEFLEQHKMLELWYKYEADALRKSVIEWCKDQGVKVSERGDG